MKQPDALTVYLPSLYGRSHGKTYSEVTFPPLSDMHPQREQDWLNFWIEWGTTASSRLLEITLWQAADWKEETLALQMLLQRYGQEEEYLFGVEWIADNICLFASKSPELLGNCFDFWSSIPNPMTVNQAVLLAVLTENVDALSQHHKTTIRERLQSSEHVSSRYDFVKEW